MLSLFSKFYNLFNYVLFWNNIIKYLNDGFNQDLYSRQLEMDNKLKKCYTDIEWIYEEIPSWEK